MLVVDGCLLAWRDRASGMMASKAGKQNASVFFQSKKGAIAFHVAGLQEGGADPLLQSYIESDDFVGE